MRPAAASAASLAARGGSAGLGLLRNRASAFVAAASSSFPADAAPPAAFVSHTLPSPSPSHPLAAMSTSAHARRSYRPSRPASSLGSKDLPPDAYTGIEIRAAMEEAHPGKRREFEGNSVEKAMEALANADAVCFDVDSTVIMEEGIDVLADYLGKGEEVAAWTKKAMEGNTKFEDALAARLEIIQPSRTSIENCLRDHPLRLSPNVDVLIDRLNERGVDVYLVSGGFRLMIEPLARELCVSKTNIIANTILFDEKTGEYRGFCSNEPTSRDMGKPAALRKLKEEHGYDRMVMVGDGATDLQAVPPADAFVGFGGVAVREAVKEGACWFVTDFADVVEVVEKFGRSKVSPGSDKYKGKKKL